MNWDDLSMAEKAEVMRIAVEGGVYDLNAIRSGYNEYAKGGIIHIKPSKRGTFTAAASKHGKSVQAFASQVLAHKENYSPAMVKKANFARNASKWKHAYGGELGNYYDGWGDAWNFLKKAKQKVHDWGLDKSPGQHILSAFGINDSTVVNPNRNKNSNIGFFEEGALDLARSFGLNKVVKGNPGDTHYRQNLYNIVDPTNAVPEAKDLPDYARAVKAAKSDRDYSYQRFVQDPAADAAWAKRLGLPYDTDILIDNGDGSVRLSKELEAQIPVDTLFLKKRIADNEDRLTKVRGRKHSITNAALDYDRAALDSLRKTYRTGKPVQLDENSAVGRDWKDDKEKITSPLNLLHRYTVQYDKKNNRMNYWDVYDFNEFEDFVPGEPFKIKGSIDLNKKKKGE